jgi:hypothetical protein
MRGAWTAVRRILVPAASKKASKDAVKFDPRPGGEVDLPEDRRQEAQRLQGHRCRPVSQDVARVLSKSSLVKIKSTLVRSIRRAQKYDLIGRNVAELVDLPQGQPGHPSRAMC